MNVSKILLCKNDNHFPTVWQLQIEYDNVFHELYNYRIKGILL